jgi:hypothetical protein
MKEKEIEGKTYQKVRQPGLELQALDLCFEPFPSPWRMGRAKLTSTTLRLSPSVQQCGF